jgi:Protein of unknown function (DUF3352)
MAKSTAIAAALLTTATVAGAGGYLYLQTKDPGDRPEQLALAVPEQAYAVGYIATDPKVWSKLDRFGNPAAKQVIDRSIQQIQKETVGDIDFAKDVQPWLGNVMLASFANDKAEEKPTVLAVSKVKDKLSAFNFLNKLKSKSKDPATESDYKGAKIWSVSGKDPFHVAYSDDWLVGSADRATVEKSIDTLKGAASFSQKNGNQFFASGRLNLPNPIASVYIDFPLMAAAVNQGKNKLDSNQIAKLVKAQSFVAGMGIDDQGLRAKALTQMNDNSFKLPATNGKVLANFPADSLLVFNGSGIKNIWDETIKQSASDPKTMGAIEDLRKSFRAQTKLDLDKDVFGWLGGEYAIGIFPQQEGLLGSFTGLGITAVVEGNEPQANQKSLDSMVKGLGAGKVVIKPRQSADGKTINDIGSPLGTGSLLSYGSIDDKTVFLSTKNSTITEPLSKGADFQKVVSTLPASDQGLTYINFRQLANVLQGAALKQYTANMPPEYFSLLKAIEGMAVSSKLDGDTYRTEGVLMLAPANSQPADIKVYNKPPADSQPPSPDNKTPDDKPPVDVKPAAPDNQPNIKPQAPAGQ